VTIVAHARPFVVGVDTHARNHEFAILVAATGELLASEQFPATPAGLNRAIAWVGRWTRGDLAVLWVIEGVATSRIPSMRAASPLPFCHSIPSSCATRAKTTVFVPPCESW
jgi:hypothetical protein